MPDNFLTGEKAKERTKFWLKVSEILVKYELDLFPSLTDVNLSLEATDSLEALLFGWGPTRYRGPLVSDHQMYGSKPRR